MLCRLENRVNRAKLLKIGALVTASVRRIVLKLGSAYRSNSSSGRSLLV